MIIAMVPMRSGSKSIPDKNIKDFCGKPLFAWNVGTLLECRKQGVVDRVYINSDTQTYHTTVSDYFQDGDLRYFARSSRTAQDNAVNIDVAQEFIEKTDMENDDILLYVQVTSPYLKV